jgi:hypothetical protein
MYNATVTGVGAGFVNADGKTLRTIGNLPVKVGDTIYTDGRIAYGHVPVRGSVSMSHRLSGIVLSGYQYTIFKDIGHRYSDARCNALDRNTNISNAFNWLYEKDNKLYGYVYGAPSDGIGDFLDIYCSDSAVYTAEYAVHDAAFEGLGQHPFSTWNYQNKHCCLSNYSYYANDNGSFELRTNEGTRVYTNSVIEIKRNGSLLKSLTLSDYKFAEDKLKELYLSYDKLDPSLKRYDGEGDYYGHITDVDIWVTFLYTQVLSFGFIDNSGNWEMIVLSMTSGTCSPHTVDEEPKRDENGEFILDGNGNYIIEEVNSFFSFYCPVIYYVMRVKSNGEASVLHECVMVQKMLNNGVDPSNEYWTNAKSVEIEEVAILTRPPFKIDFGNYSLLTNLSSIIEVRDSDGRIIAGALPLPNFKKFTMTDYTQPPPMVGADSTTYLLEIDLETGKTTTLSDYDVISSGVSLGYMSGYGYSSRQEISSGIMVLTQDAPSYIGRVSVYQFKNKQRMMCIRKQATYYQINGNWYMLNQTPANINMELTRDIRKVKKIKSINDLIADVTKPKNG